MCLAVPGEVLSLETGDALPMGRVGFGGVVKRVCLAYTPEADVGDFVLVHAGFALTRLSSQRALEILSTLASAEAAEQT